jgi:hypothetical protein
MGGNEMEHAESEAIAEAIYIQGLANVCERPEPTGQKFSVGSRVKIADDLGESMRHFPAGKLATVEFTYAHAYGGGDNKSYSLNVDGIGSIAWYHEEQLSGI